MPVVYRGINYFYSEMFQSVNHGGVGKFFFFFFNGWEEFFAHLTRSGLYVAVIEHIIIIVLFPGNIIKKSPNRGMENDPIKNSLVNHQREAFPVNSITGDLVYHHAYLFPQGILQFPAR